MFPSKVFVVVPVVVEDFVDINGKSVSRGPGPEPARLYFDHRQTVILIALSKPEFSLHIIFGVGLVFARMLNNLDRRQEENMWITCAIICDHSGVDCSGGDIGQRLLAIHQARCQAVPGNLDRIDMGGLLGLQYWSS